MHFLWFCLLRNVFDFFVLDKSFVGFLVTTKEGDYILMQ